MRQNFKKGNETLFRFMDYEREYYRIATIAIKAKSLTPRERDMISRVGTRKQGYWARHLYDLCKILNRRAIPSGLQGEITRWLTPPQE